MRHKTKEYEKNLEPVSIPQAIAKIGLFLGPIVLTGIAGYHVGSLFEEDSSEYDSKKSEVTSEIEYLEDSKLQLKMLDDSVEVDLIKPDVYARLNTQIEANEDYLEVLESEAPREFPVDPSTTGAFIGGLGVYFAIAGRFERSLYKKPV